MELSREGLTLIWVHLVDHLSVSMESVVDSDWPPDLDLSIPQVRTLRMLRQRPLGMSEVAASLPQNLSQATAVVGRLVEKALVEWAGPTSGLPSAVYSLTASGERTFDLLGETRHAELQKVANALDPSELNDVVRATEFLVIALERWHRAQHPSGGRPRAAPAHGA